MTIKPEQHAQKEETLEKADQIYEKARENQLHQRLGNEKVREATLKIAARQEQEMLQNLDQFKHFDRRGLEKGVRKIARTLDEYTPPYKAQVYLQPFQENPDIKEEVVKKAEEILEQVEDSQRLVGRSSTAKAGAAVYIGAVITDNYMPNDKITEIGDVSEPTLRQNYTAIVEETGMVEVFLDMHPYPSRTSWSEQVKPGETA